MSGGLRLCLLSARRFRGDCGRSYVDIVYWEDIITLWRLERDFAEYCRGFTLSYVGKWTTKHHQLILYSYSIFYILLLFQVLCTIGKLKEIPKDFPLETEEITISNQDIRTIQPSSKKQFLSSTEFH